MNKQNIQNIETKEEMREKLIRKDTEAAACVALFVIAMLVIGVFL